MPKILYLFGRLMFELSVHVVAASVIFATFLPLARWYIEHKPILGVDFYNMVSNAAYYSRHYDPRFLGYKPISWSGYSYMNDYPSLHFYLIRPLVDRFGAQLATFYYTMGAMYLLAICSYFLFFVISRNAILATILSILGLYSIGTWGTVIWGGNLQYFATMPFLPMSAGFLVLYLFAKTRKHLIAAALIAGISTLGHPQVMASYILPFAAFVILFGHFDRIRASIKRRIVDFLIFFGVLTLVGYQQLQMVLGGVIFFAPLNLINYLDLMIRTILGTKLNYGYAVPSNVAQETAQAIVDYNKNQFFLYKSEIHQGFFILGTFSLLLSIVGVIIAKRRTRILTVVAFAIFLGFLFAYIWALSRGFSLFHGGWYRVFWPFPIAYGAVIAASYHVFWKGLVDRLGKFSFVWLRTILLAILSGAIFLGGYFFWQKTTVFELTDKMATSFREKSGAYPDFLNQPFSEDKFRQLGEKLVPSWLSGQDQQFRLYTADQKVNIWWPAFYDLPLFRGYNDAPIGTDRAGGYFWTDIAIASNAGRDPLVEDFKTPVEIAKNNALFLIDWFSIGYFEGGHGGSDSFNPPASYLLSDANIFDRQEEIIFPGQFYFEERKTKNKYEWTNDSSRSLKYFKFKDGLASPIASATNASVIGLCGDFHNWEAFIRVLGATNTNSAQIVPLWLCESLEDLPDLGNLDIDALVLYGYLDGDDRDVLSKIDSYVQGGGKLFVETGADVFQSEAETLPDFFPIEGTARVEIGTNWKLADFSPPVIDGEPWLFSLPTALKSGSESLLADSDHHFIVSGAYGSGQVIWSGVNIFSHINTHKNIREAEFAKSLLSKLVTLDPAKNIESKTEFVSNRKIRIATDGARAVLLRQNYDWGWQARLDGKRIPIYKTGPIYPGFMYVSIPKDMSSQAIVEFSYHGDWWTASYTILTLMIVIFAIDYFLGSHLYNFAFGAYKKLAGKKIGNWWKREDE